MRKEDFFRINYNNGHKTPKELFLGLEDLNPEIIIAKSNFRFLIKKKLFDRNGNYGYINIAYAQDLTHPIYKIYYSFVNSGIEFVSYRFSKTESFDQNTESIDINDYIDIDWDVIQADLSVYEDIEMDEDNLIKFIGLGCLMASETTINKKFHLSKLSPIIFSKMASLNKKIHNMSLRKLIQFAFNEIEKDEIISVYEKKVIFQKILDKYL